MQGSVNSFRAIQIAQRPSSTIAPPAGTWNGMLRMLGLRGLRAINPATRHPERRSKNDRLVKGRLIAGFKSLEAMERLKKPALIRDEAGGERWQVSSGMAFPVITISYG